MPFSHPLLLSRTSQAYFKEDGPWYVNGGSGPMINGNVVPPWVFLSTTVLVHSVMVSMERFANWFVTLPMTSPLMRADRREYEQQLKAAGRMTKAGSRKMAGVDSGPEDRMSSSIPALPTNPRLVRLLRRPVDFEGAPVWGIFGFIEWLFVTCALIALFFVYVSLITRRQFVGHLSV